jgi:CheY-like chemotaxis protein
MLTFQTSRTLADETFPAEAPEIGPGPYTVLSVADTGVGMDEQTQAHIFEPFFTTKEVGKGTGLGLATVYGIVKQSGGYIYVHSCPEAGTTFRIYLPEVSERPTSRMPRESPPAVRGAETILLVEDDDNVRGLTRSILERAGYRVLEAADGVQALGLYEHGVPFDLLLTDAILPHLSGRLLADRLTASRPGLKVLFMSGYTEDHVLRHGVQHATIPFLQKPFYPADLTAAVRRALDS